MIQLKPYAGRILSRLLALVFINILPQISIAHTLPQWELGAGSVSLQVPNYRGSDEKKNYSIPYPYLIYRGDTFNVDEKGLKSWLFKSERVELDFSFAPGLPVSSNQNSVRSGMDKLNPTVEIGPSIEIPLWSAQKAKHSLWLKLPLRAMFSIDFPSLPYEGWIFAPYLQLNFAHYNHDYWKSSISFGPMYADTDYHHYYYGIDSHDVTLTRQAYQGKSGYNGSRFILSLRKKIGDLMFVAFARYDNLNGVVFEKSPLLKTKRYAMAGVAITWIFKKSPKQVEVMED